MDYCLVNGQHLFTCTDSPCGAERWHAPRSSLFDSLREGPDGLRELPRHSKDYLLKWDLDITRFHTEDLVGPLSFWRVSFSVHVLCTD